MPENMGRGGMTSGQGSEKPVDSVLADADDTPLTDVLLDQFAAYYTVTTRDGA